MNGNRRTHMKNILYNMNIRHILYYITTYYYFRSYVRLTSFLQCAITSFVVLCLQVHVTHIYYIHCPYNLPRQNRFHDIRIVDRKFTSYPVRCTGACSVRSVCFHQMKRCKVKGQHDE